MGIGIILKLKKFLTPRNLQYLDILLGLVVDKNSPAFEPLWESFKERFPPEYQRTAEDAIEKLRDLRLLVQQYRNKDQEQPISPEWPTE